MYSSSKSDLHTVVNGVTDKGEIASSFQNHFVNVSKPNNQERVDELNREFQKEYKKACDSHSDCSCSVYEASLENILDATFKLKKGKSSDDSLVSAEHFFNAPLILFDRLQRLFNQMLQHGHVPFQFKCGTIVPIVKDRQGNLGDMNNYRGITIAPVISKIFEYVQFGVFSVCG